MKNNYRDSLPARVFDARGNLTAHRGSGVIYDSRGKAIDSPIIEKFTAAEIVEEMHAAAAIQGRMKWVDRRARQGGEVLAKLESFKYGQEADAMKLI
ncbi:MAG: hypothetical protein AABW59_00460, partial [archaeon]